MNEHDHTRYEDELAAYMLDALTGDEAREFERHLEGCARCQERARWLQPSVELLPMTVAQVEPPAELRERLMSTVRAEAAAPARRTPARELRAPRARGGWLRGLVALPRPALALGAVLVAIAGGVIGYALGTGDDGTTTSTISAQVSVPGARATLERDGDSGVLRVSGLPQRRNRIYEVWLARGQEVRPAGLFQVDRNGDAAAAISRGLDRTDRVMVSLEPPRGSLQPTTEPLLVAEV